MLTKTIDLWCDWCNVWTHIGGDVTGPELRKNAKAEGWGRLRHADGYFQDLCPACMADPSRYPGAN